MADAFDSSELLSKETYLEALGRLQRIQIDRYNARRSLEWRLTFTIWGGLLLAANALRGIDRIPAGLFWVVLLLIVALQAFWEHQYVVRGAEPNRLYGIALDDEIREVTKFDWKPKTDHGVNPWAAHYWQVGVTVLLGLVVWAAIYWG